ncbi:MAG: glycosyltransferase [Cytophagales bacterium]|nr:MAG: glycosyltransferase [Cytophagales bacterium]
MLSSQYDNAYLAEIAWEVCNQVGGIYTVIRSKIPSIKSRWGENYFLIGPYLHTKTPAEFEPSFDYNNPIGRAVEEFRKIGVEVHYGTWLVSGSPKLVLINPQSYFYKMGEVKFLLWEKHGISSPEGDHLLNQVVVFGHLVAEFFKYFSNPEIGTSNKIVAHFHEWMVGTAIPEMRRCMVPVSTVFTTHATMLGRYLAMNDHHFYEHLPFYNWEVEARNFNIETHAKIERAAAHGAHVFTTVSEVTARECIALLGRNPDVILPNGLNIQRFTAAHEFQNLHLEYKEKIHEFVMGHFFQSYSFDLDKTLYFFTSGRYEYRNKGFDLTLEALARLNWRMQQAGMDTTIVMFFITKQPYHSMNPQVLQSRAMMEEIRQTCEAIKDQLGERLFHSVASNDDLKLPDLNYFVDDYWKLRLRRELQSWKQNELPYVVTHNLINTNDELMQTIRTTNMVNNAHDKVKIVYHPDFISPTNPLFGLEYGQFVRGCNLGIFPSYYEPWGYTPLESIASGVPAITSDLAGFGDFVMQTIQEKEDKGLYVVNRRNKDFYQAADQLTEQLFSFVQMSRRDRITQRYKTENCSENFSWQKLTAYYERAYIQAFEKYPQ